MTIEPILTFSAPIRPTEKKDTSDKCSAPASELWW
jgi:hypothetical protein